MSPVGSGMTQPQTVESQQCSKKHALLCCVSFRWPDNTTLNFLLHTSRHCKASKRHVRAAWTRRSTSFQHDMFHSHLTRALVERCSSISVLHVVAKGLPRFLSLQGLATMRCWRHKVLQVADRCRGGLAGTLGSRGLGDLCLLSCPFLNPLCLQLTQKENNVKNTGDAMIALFVDSPPPVALIVSPFGCAAHRSG